ncbi:hypothetical protein ACWD4N_47930 [Streptomyces sp. NPDC002586]
MELQQLNGGYVDPGFRLDLDGNARFVHEGYTVDVHVRRATAQDMPYYPPVDPDPYDVVITGTVRLDGVDVGEHSAGANERDGYVMRSALEEVLREAVEDARRTVKTLVSRVEAIDRKHAANRATTSGHEHVGKRTAGTT